MKTAHTIQLKIVKNLIFVSIFLLIGFFLWKINTVTPAFGGTSMGYPAPATIVSASEAIERSKTGYPAPVSISTLDWKTQKDDKLKPLSPTDQAIIATDTFMKRRAATGKTPSSTKTPSTFLVTSIADLPRIINHPSIFGRENKEYKDCISKGDFRPPIFVHALNNFGDYYIIPFYKDNKVCSKVLVRVKDNQGDLIGWSDSHETVYPQISAAEAAKRVEEEKGEKTSGEAELVYQAFSEFADPFNPFWRVVTTGGKVYYVSFITGILEDETKTTIVKVWMSEDLHLNH